MTRAMLAAMCGLVLSFSSAGELIAPIVGDSLSQARGDLPPKR